VLFLGGRSVNEGPRLRKAESCLAQVWGGQKEKKCVLGRVL
jgi:hypothetical protein